jgi:hypothetical protein
MKEKEFIAMKNYQRLCDISLLTNSLLFNRENEENDKNIVPKLTKLNFLIKDLLLDMEAIVGNYIENEDEE